VKVVERRFQESARGGRVAQAAVDQDSGGGGGDAESGFQRLNVARIGAGK